LETILFIWTKLSVGSSYNTATLGMMFVVDYTTSSSVYPQK